LEYMLRNVVPSIVRLVKYRTFCWTGHVRRIGEIRNTCRILVGKQVGNVC
jgi:hypothetical protein